MPPSSSSRRPTAPTRRAARCGTSASSSGCRGRSSSPSSTPATPTSRPPWPTARPTSAPASSRSACRSPGEAGAVTSIADLLLGEVHDYSGGTRTVRPAGPEHADVFDTYRPALIEGIIEESEDSGPHGPLPRGRGARLRDAREGPAHRGRPRHLPPGAPAVRRRPAPGSACSCTSSRRHSRTPGCTRSRRSPRSAAAPRSRVTADPDGPLVAEVVHTESDAYVGHLSLVRVFSGTLRPTGRCTCRATSSCSACRPARVTRPTTRTCGPAPSPRPSTASCCTKTEAIAGEVVVVTKLATAQTSDTISSPEAPAARHAVGPARGPAARRGGRHQPGRRGPDAGRLP